MKASTSLLASNIVASLPRLDGGHSSAQRVERRRAHQPHLVCIAQLARRAVKHSLCGGQQVQLTEAAFVLGEEQLGAGMVAPVITPAGTNGQDPLFMNNADPGSGDQSNCDPLPCSFTYTFDAVVTPDIVRIAYADSLPRWPTSLDVEYLDATTGSWTHFSTTTPVPDPGYVQYADIPIMSASHVDPACISAPRSSFTTIHLEEFERGIF